MDVGGNMTANALAALIRLVRRLDTDPADNWAFLAQRKLRMPTLTLGGEKSFGLARNRLSG